MYKQNPIDRIHDQDEQPSIESLQEQLRIALRTIQMRAQAIENNIARLAALTGHNPPEVQRHKLTHLVGLANEYGENLLSMENETEFALTPWHMPAGYNPSGEVKQKLEDQGYELDMDIPGDADVHSTRQGTDVMFSKVGPAKKTSDFNIPGETKKVNDKKGEGVDKTKKDLLKQMATRTKDKAQKQARGRLYIGSTAAAGMQAQRLVAAASSVPFTLSPNTPKFDSQEIDVIQDAGGIKKTHTTVTVSTDSNDDTKARVKKAVMRPSGVPWNSERASNRDKNVHMDKSLSVNDIGQVLDPQWITNHRKRKREEIDANNTTTTATSPSPANSYTEILEIMYPSSSARNSAEQPSLQQLSKEEEQLLDSFLDDEDLRVWQDAVENKAKEEKDIFDSSARSPSQVNQPDEVAMIKDSGEAVNHVESDNGSMDWEANENADTDISADEEVRRSSLSFGNK